MRRSHELGNSEYDPSYDPEKLESDGERERTDIDLRRETDVFADHERVDMTDDETNLARLRDTLAEDSEGIIHLGIPSYQYDFATNPFIGMGPTVIRTYQIARHLDVVFLHRFMYQDILVVGVRSREYVNEAGRLAFARHIRDTGGVTIGDEQAPYDFLAMKFSPYVASDTTAAFFTLYHKQEPRLAERPQYPIDIWMIYDALSYEMVEGSEDSRKPYRLKPGYDRRASLLGVAQIN